MMLPSKYRIKGSKNVEEVKRSGKMLQGQSFGLAVLKKKWQEIPGFAFVISTKISKLAVSRNRINRAMQEGVRRVLPKIPSNYLYCFLAKKQLATMSTEEIINEVSEFMSDLNLD